MKSLKLLLTGSMVVLLMNCSGGSGGDSQQQETASQENPTEKAAQEEPETVSPELTQKLDTGKAIYEQYCIVCHQADGSGVTGAFPPLKESDWISGDNTRLITTVINGLQGPVEVKGEQYNNVMPSHGFLTDEQIAGVLSYVRKSFGNNAEEISVEEVKQVRESVQADTTAK